MFICYFSVLLYVVSYLILITMLWDRIYSYHHFIWEESKAEKLGNISKVTHLITVRAEIYILEV